MADVSEFEKDGEKAALVAAAIKDRKQTAGVDAVSVPVALRGTSTPVLSSSSWSDVLDFVPGLFEQDAEKQALVAAAIKDRKPDDITRVVDLQDLTVEVVVWVRAYNRAEFFLEDGKLWVLFRASGHTLLPQLERLQEFADGKRHREACAMFDFVVSKELLTLEETSDKSKLGIKARVDAFKPSRKRMIQVLFGAHFRKLQQTKKQAAVVAASAAAVKVSAAAACARLACAVVKEEVPASAEHVPSFPASVSTLMIRPKHNGFDGFAIDTLLKDQGLGSLVERTEDGRYKIKTNSVDKVKAEMLELAEVEEWSAEQVDAAKAFGKKRGDEEAQAAGQALNPREQLHAMDIIKACPSDELLRSFAHVVNSRQESLVQRGFQHSQNKKARKMAAVDEVKVEENEMAQPV
jgi:hypothetical protein